ncbi:MAG: ribonuclease III [Lachnospiraceae bacterium]|nr:ribonuclease III [Lachnospiraceae bacterium]
MNTNIAELEERIGYSFKNSDYLYVALTHSSFSNEMKIKKCDNYERQEFLGDAVLELVSSDHLYREHPGMPEGDLTKLRASMVCEPALANAARCFGLDDFIRLGRGEEATGGRAKESIISDVLEAVIGGIYLDSGIEAARRFILKFVMCHEDEIVSFGDAKSKLQQLVQAKGKTVTYEVTGESGPDHAKVFTVDCLIDGKKVSSGQGRTKKSAQQDAAGKVLRSGSCI